MHGATHKLLKDNEHNVVIAEKCFAGDSIRDSTGSNLLTNGGATFLHS